jgi:hypothetical protein
VSGTRRQVFLLYFPLRFFLDLFFHEEKIVWYNLNEPHQRFFLDLDGTIIRGPLICMHTGCLATVLWLLWANAASRC